MSVEHLYWRDAERIADAIKVRFYPLAVARAEGCRVGDVAGKEYLDFAAGWTMSSTGYGHPSIKRAITEQLHRASFASLTSGVHEPALDLADKLVQLTPGTFHKKVWFGLTGSDASETVGRLLPLATGRRRLISFIGAYHGGTEASMALSAHASQTQFLGSSHVIKVPYPNPYRCPFGDETADCARSVIRYLEDYLFQTVCPPEDVAGVIVEAVQSDAGDIVPPTHFLPMLEDVCRRHNIYLVLDEVKVGLGRTGEMFAFQHYGITPDAVILGKSLGGGLPLSAVVARREILDAGTGLCVFTAAGNILSCTAGLAVIEAIERDGMVANARQMGKYLHEQLTDLKEKHALIGDVRGLGLIQGIELIKDRASKAPARAAAAKVVYRAFELGLLLFYVGMFSNVLEITPPLILTKAEVDEGVAILDQALSDVMAGRVADEAVAPYAGW